MKQKQLFRRWLALLAALCIVAAVGMFSVSAEPVDGNPGEVVTDEQPQSQQEQPQEQPQEQQQVEPETQAAPTEQQYEPIYEYINGESDNANSTYEEPEHLNDLPAVSNGEVEIPKAVVIPDVAVSDASLLSGIVMWLCVALGIAVIVGVMVSKRTLRRGA